MAGCAGACVRAVSTATHPVTLVIHYPGAPAGTLTYTCCPDTVTVRDMYNCVDEHIRVCGDYELRVIAGDAYPGPDERPPELTRNSHLRELVSRGVREFYVHIITQWNLTVHKDTTSGVSIQVPVKLAYVRFGEVLTLACSAFGISPDGKNLACKHRHRMRNVDPGSKVMRSCLRVPYYIV